MSPRPEGGLFTVDEIAAYLRVSRWTVYRLVRDGGLTAVKVGTRLRFREIDVVRFIDRSGVATIETTR